MTLLLSWIGIADYYAWKQERTKGDGPLLAVARHVRAEEVEILWDDPSTKVPLSESADYSVWLAEQLRQEGIDARVRIHSCENAAITDFGWVYRQVEKLREIIDLSKKPVYVNASSGTWIMSACWIVFKKACGLDLRLFLSSVEAGVVPIKLPPNLTIDMTEVLQGRRSPLLDRYSRGDIRLSLDGFQDLINKSEQMTEVLLKVTLLARFTDVPVLLLGPPGVGKTRLAEIMHRLSKCKGGFRTIDCGTLGDERSLGEIWGWKKGAYTGANADRKGRIEGARDGTLFLDEIGNADPRTQQNFLRLLHNKKYRQLGDNEELDIDTRVIAATNSDLRKEMQDNKFRQDLFDRLSVYVIEVPPLRARPEDIAPFARGILREFNAKWGNEIEDLDGSRKLLSAAAEDELQRYEWPGNFRELENVMTRLAIQTISSAPEITAEDVKQELSVGRSKVESLLAVEPLGSGFDLDRVLDRVRYHYVQEAWTKTGGICSQAARLLGYSNRKPLLTIIERLKKAGYSIDGN